MSTARWLILLCLALVGLWVRGEIGRARAQGRADVFAARADSLAAAWRADSARRAAADQRHAVEDSLRAQAARQSSAEFRRLRRAAATAWAERDSLVLMLRASNSDSAALAGIVAITDTLHAEALACGVALTDCQALASARVSRIVELERRLTEASAVVASQRAALDRLAPLTHRGPDWKPWAVAIVLLIGLVLK